VLLWVLLFGKKKFVGIVCCVCVYFLYIANVEDDERGVGGGRGGYNCVKREKKTVLFFYYYMFERIIYYSSSWTTTHKKKIYAHTCVSTHLCEKRRKKDRGRYKISFFVFFFNKSFHKY
jgi:hypothetical protein